MKNRASTRRVLRPSASPREVSVRDYLTIKELKDSVAAWLVDSEIRLSPKTTLNRKFLTDKLIWWFETNGVPVCDKRSMQRFFHYLATAHTLPEGRWGTAEQPANDPDARTEMRPRSRANYFRWLRTFFLWCVADGTLDASPLASLSPPIHKDDQVHPFTMQQVETLLQAAKKGRNGARDVAIILMFCDTGVRASELAGLSYDDFSISERTIKVRGKGNTHRTLPLSPVTLKAVITYLRSEHRQPGEPLFTSFGGNKSGEAMTASGIGQLIRKAGSVAGIDSVRCSPHTFRHFFAVEFLRSGGDLLTLQTMYGHTSTEMTQRYVMIAQADVSRNHKAHSPANRLKR